MVKLMDLTGQKFNKLTVLGRSEKTSNVGAMWSCLCDCGTVTVVESMKLRKGSTKSCGCHRAALRNMQTHGLSNKSGTYKSWKEMRSRCNNPRAHNFKWYGGRGISICERWNNYEAFLADMGPRPDGTTIDRIDSDGNYEPGNCRWATAAEQATTNRGVIRKGASAPNKIPESIINEMVRLRKEGMTYAAIGRQFGIHHATVSAKVKGVG